MNGVSGQPCSGPHVGSTQRHLDSLSDDGAVSDECSETCTFSGPLTTRTPKDSSFRPVKPIPPPSHSSADTADIWIRDLNLPMSDKDILDRGHWINDRIILAVFKILREDPRTANVGGL